MGGTGNEAKASVLKKTQGLCHIRLVEMLEQSLVMKLAVRSKLSNYLIESLRTFRLCPLVILGESSAQTRPQALCRVHSEPCH